VDDVDPRARRRARGAATAARPRPADHDAAREAVGGERRSRGAALLGARADAPATHRRLGADRGEQPAGAVSTEGGERITQRRTVRAYVLLD
jgi:hypothetical protein